MKELNKMEPIDKALERLDGGETKADKKRHVDPVDSELVGILGLYPKMLSQCFGLNYNITFATMCAEYIRFTKNCEITFLDVPKEKVIGFMREDPNLELLLSSTDFNKLVPEWLQIGGARQEDRIIDNLFHLADIPALINAAKANFCIWNLEFMSLFIEEGKKLRAYASKVVRDDSQKFGNTCSGMDRGKILGWHGHRSPIFTVTPKDVRVNLDFKPFDPKDLRLFYEITGIKDVSGMVEQVYELYNEMREWASTDSKSMPRERLFCRLEKYSPSLVYNGG